MTMELTGATTETALASSLFHWTAAVAKAALLRRRQRIALAELMRMNPARLDDLGLERQDILLALSVPTRAGRADS